MMANRCWRTCPTPAIGNRVSWRWRCGGGGGGGNEVEGQVVDLIRSLQVDPNRVVFRFALSAGKGVSTRLTDVIPTEVGDTRVAKGGMALWQCGKGPNAVNTSRCGLG